MKCRSACPGPHLQCLPTTEQRSSKFEPRGGRRACKLKKQGRSCTMEPGTHQRKTPWMVNESAFRRALRIAQRGPTMESNVCRHQTRSWQLFPGPTAPAHRDFSSLRTEPNRDRHGAEATGTDLSLEVGAEGKLFTGMVRTRCGPSHWFRSSFPFTPFDLIIPIDNRILSDL